MIETYRFRLYPTNDQKVLLAKHFGSVRFVYNWYLDYNQKQYTTNEKFVGWMSLIPSQDFKKLKAENPWLKEINSQSIISSISHCDKAFQRFFKHISGFPKFKSKKSNQFSFECPQGLELDFKHKKIFIPKFKKDGGIKCMFSRKVKPGKIGTATISRNPAGQYFVSFIVHTTEKEKDLIDKSKITKENSIGIDFGLKHFLTLSDGRQIDSPEFFKHTLDKLKLRQRQFSKTKSDSHNHERMRIKVAKIHNKIRNQRIDFLHKLSTSLVNDNQIDCICIEDLNMKGISKLWGRKVGDLSYYSFTSMLDYKMKRRGKYLLKIGRFDPSSQICSHCGYRKKLSLDERIYNCPKCGTSLDRDMNAAINIRNFAMRKLISNTVGSTGINACGDGSSGLSNVSCLSETTVREARKIRRKVTSNGNDL